MRILHVLHSSAPMMSGYSVRSSAILHFERLAGLQVSAITSARHVGPPVDRETIDGVTYRRTPQYAGPNVPFIREWQLTSALRRSLADEIRAVKPDLVHAHSPVLVGFPALRAAREVGIPLVYEVRDLWENASVDRKKFGEGSLLYRCARASETFVLRRADAVVAICNGLRDDIAARLPDQRKLLMVGNGVDATMFAPRRPSAEWMARHGLNGGHLLAYVGAFQPYEGLPLLVGAMKGIVDGCPAAQLAIVGDGDARVELEALASSLGIRANVVFLGRLPHTEVGEMYSAADVLVYPRIATRTTALTTPLKPLEAMAMEKAVLASDVAGLRELVSAGRTGVLFRAGDAADLARECVKLLRNPAQRADLGRAARAWILEERQWSVLVGAYTEIYRQLVPEPELDKRNG